MISANEMAVNESLIMWNSIIGTFERASEAGQSNAWSALFADAKKNLEAGKLGDAQTEADMLLKLVEWRFSSTTKDPKNFALMKRQLCQTLKLLAEIAGKKGEFEKVDSLQRQAQTLSEQSCEQPRDAMLLQLDAQAASLEKVGNYLEALPIRRQAVARAEVIFGRCMQLKPYLGRLAFNLSELNFDAEAETLFQDILKLHQTAEDFGISYAVSQNYLATIFYKQQKIDEADKMFRAALESLDKAEDGRKNPVSKIILMFLALISQSRGQIREADEFFRVCLVITEEIDGVSSPQTAKCLEQYANSLRKVGRETEAATLLACAKVIRDQQ